VAESGLEGYGEEAAVLEVSFGIVVRSSEYEGEPYPASRRPVGLGQTETEGSERPSS
jgi:hypothetical protein